MGDYFVGIGTRLEWAESGDRYTVVGIEPDDYITLRDGGRYTGKISKRSIADGRARVIESAPPRKSPPKGGLT